MNKKRLLVWSMCLFLITGLFTTNYALGSWIRMYPKDLIEKSDVIVIGEVFGPIGVEKRITPPPHHLWVTNWKVNVHYYLKGKEHSRELLVSTPGVQNQPHFFLGFENRFFGPTLWSSNNFRLDLEGNLVLLFLQKGSLTLEPLNPQGIIPLALNQTGGSNNKYPSGEEVSKLYTFSDQYSSKENIEEFKDFIKQAPIVIPTDEVPLRYSPAVNYSTLDKIIITGTILVILTVFIGLLLLIRKYKAGVRNII